MMVSTNQTRWTIWVFHRRLVGSHSILHCYFEDEQIVQNVIYISCEDFILDIIVQYCENRRNKAIL